MKGMKKPTKILAKFKKGDDEASESLTDTLGTLSIVVRYAGAGLSKKYWASKAETKDEATAVVQFYIDEYNNGDMSSDAIENVFDEVGAAMKDFNDNFSDVQQKI